MNSSHQLVLITSDESLLNVTSHFKPFVFSGINLILMSNILMKLHLSTRSLTSSHSFILSSCFSWIQPVKYFKKHLDPDTACFVFCFFYFLFDQFLILSISF